MTGLTSLDVMQYRFGWQYKLHTELAEAWDEYCWIMRVHAEEEGQ